MIEPGAAASPSRPQPRTPVPSTTRLLPLLPLTRVSEQEHLHGPEGPNAEVRHSRHSRRGEPRAYEHAPTGAQYPLHGLAGLLGIIFLVDDRISGNRAHSAYVSNRLMSSSKAFVAKCSRISSTDHGSLSLFVWTSSTSLSMHAKLPLKEVPRRSKNSDLLRTTATSFVAERHSYAIATCFDVLPPLLKYTAPIGTRSDDLI